MPLSVSLNRRQFLLGAAALPAVAPSVAAARSASDVRVRSMDIGYEDFLYRVPIKFGGRVLDRVTLLNVHCVVEGAERADGDGVRLDAARQRLVVALCFDELRPDPAGDERSGRADRYLIPGPLRLRPSDRSHDDDRARVPQSRQGTFRQSCPTRFRSSAHWSRPARSTRRCTMPTAAITGAAHISCWARSF